jgi:hypothetical protein
MKYDVHYYKTTNLTPDERAAMRSNQAGVWLMGVRVEAGSPHQAVDKGRQAGMLRGKLRARRVEQ